MRTLAALLVATVVACGHQVAPPPDAFAGLCSDQVAAAPTFTNVQRLFSSVCTVCHTTGAALVLLPQVSYANLIGVTAPNYTDPAIDESCGGVLVQPGDPAASYLYQKLSSDTPCAGVRMPRDDIGGSSPLIPCEQQLVHDWIAAGAPND